MAISFYRKEKSRKRISNPLITDIFDFTDAEISEEKETDLGLLNHLISNLGNLNKALMLLYLEEKTIKKCQKSSESQKPMSEQKSVGHQPLQIYNSPMPILDYLLFK